METLIWPTFNVVVLLGGLVYFLRTPVKNFVSGRHANLKLELERVEAQLKEAQHKYDEFSGKLKAIEAEVSAIQEQSRKDAESLRIKVTQDAKKLATTIVDDARSSVQSVFLDFKKQITAELATQVMDRAEQQIRTRLTGDDKVRIRAEFSQQLGSERV